MHAYCLCWWFHLFLYSPLRCVFFLIYILYVFITFFRKSWLVPTQYLLGLFMLYLSVTVNSLMQSEGGPNVVALTAVFFMLAFLAATQVGKHGDTNTHTQEDHLHNIRWVVPPVLQFLCLLCSLGHSCGWLGPDYVIQRECRICFYLQLCGPDSGILPGECALSGSGVRRLLQQIPQSRAQGQRHRHLVRYLVPLTSQRLCGFFVTLYNRAVILSSMKCNFVILSFVRLQSSCFFGELCSWFPRLWWPSWKEKMIREKESHESRRKRRASWKPTSCYSLSSRCPQSLPFVPCSSPPKYLSITWNIFGLLLKYYVESVAYTQISKVN